MTRLAPALLLVVAIAGCGKPTGSSERSPSISVSAASSLTEALNACAPTIEGTNVQLEFGGSDELYARITQGVRPDVFAAASPKFPEQLFKDHVGDRPVPFATNTLVLAVPKDSTSLHRFADLVLHPETTLAVGSASVPIGDYTRQVLAHVPADARATIEKEFRSEEPDVKGIVGKLLTGAVDAGFVYRTDVQAANGKLRGIPLPAGLEPTVVYEASRLRPNGKPFMDSLLHGTCARALLAHGFGPPPDVG